jgi:predicted lysophospholipase L1 biosynthesis ABC-type transport system permease subunit
MKKILRVLVPAAFLLLAPFFAQAAVDDFQVTGNVTEKTADSITVMKGKERFQIAIDKDTKMTGDVKVGGKVTIKYKMHASSIEAKEAAAKKEAKPAKTK